MNVYTDTSSFLRAFLADAPEHRDARALFLAVTGVGWLSSELLRVEARRTARKYVNEDGVSDSLLTSTDDYVTRHISRAALSPDIVVGAFAMTQTIKTADALHLATAMRLSATVAYVLTSDRTMYRVGTELGLTMTTIPELLDLVRSGQ